MARSRGVNGEGTITQRKDGRWQAAVTLGDGRRKFKYFHSYEEARTWRASVIRDRDRGLPIVRDERATLGPFLLDWVERKRNLEESTRRRYRELFTLHLLPTLGRVPLARLRPEQLERLYRALEDGTAAGRDGKGLSSSTVHRAHTALHGALRDALRKGLVDRNVADLVERPRDAEFEAQTWTRARCLVFLESIKGTRMDAPCALTLSTGLREGEMLALTWSDLDWDTAQLRVHATLQRVTGKGLIVKGHTKTHRNRVLILPPSVLTVLREHHARQARERLALGTAWEEQGLMFPNTIGKPMDAAHFYRREYLPLLVRVGLPRIRFHDLRHTILTLLVEAGTGVKGVSAMAGHASTRTTLDVYTHTTDGMRRETADAVERLLWRRG